MTWMRGLLGVCAVALLAACSGNVDTNGTGGAGGTGGSGGDGASAGAGGEGGATSTNTGGMVNTTIDTGTGTGTGTGSGPCDPGQPSVDDDGDGFNELEGDCNDCNPVVSPGSIEVIATEPDPNGQIPEPADEDCNGVVDDLPPKCDDALALEDGDPASGAKAMDLCRFTTPQDVTWGVLSAAYVRASGAGAPDPRQWGIKPGFGAGVSPQGGARLLVLSSGHARAPGDPDECGMASCTVTNEGVAPPGFPQPVPGCEAANNIADDVALELQIRTPVNAKGYSFDSRIFSFEYPEWVCSSYNDQFVALVSPAPGGAMGGNVAFDPSGIPLGVNADFFDVCDPAGAGNWATSCGNPCPPLPDPYCPAGPADLLGTGFQEWDPMMYAGATAWLRTAVPLGNPGEVITVRLAIWDAADQGYDSTVLLDDWQWLTKAPSGAATDRIPDPK